jgi:Flp pilus assembly pilin Flp
MFAHVLSYFHIRRLWKNTLGATATEYAFIIAFIAIVASAGMSILGVNLSEFYNSIGSALSEMSCRMPDTASDNGSGNSNRCKDKNP